MKPLYINTNKLTDLRLKDGTFDHLFLSSDFEKAIENIQDDWEYSTKINADYSESMDGGNTGFSLKNTDTIIVKRRERGTMDWITVFTIPINRLEDFNFLKEYQFGESQTNYDFMIISSIGGIQNSYEIAECYSEFEGLCLADGKKFYRTIYNVEPVNITQNNNNSTLTLLNNTYPVVVSNDDTNYSSGTVSAVFLKEDGSDFASGKKLNDYRMELLHWLTNKKAKILKLDDGTVKMIRVVGNPSITDGGHPDLKNIVFDFAEIGSTDSEADLYYNALSDVEPNRW